MAKRIWKIDDKHIAKRCGFKFKKTGFFRKLTWNFSETKRD